MDYDKNLSFNKKTILLIKRFKTHFLEDIQNIVDFFSQIGYLFYAYMVFSGRFKPGDNDSLIEIIYVLSYSSIFAKIFISFVCKFRRLRRFGYMIQFVVLKMIPLLILIVLILLYLALIYLAIHSE